MPLDALIKFRCEQSLEARLHRIAAADRRELANMLRNVLEDYATEQERKLGLVVRDQPSSPAESAALAEIERAAAAARSGHSAAGASYSRKGRAKPAKPQP